MFDAFETIVEMLSSVNTLKLLYIAQIGIVGIIDYNPAKNQ